MGRVRCVSEPEALFSELSHRVVPDAPAPPVPTGRLPDPAAPPLAINDATDHGRVVRGTEVIKDGLRYRQLADGRLYVLDESGSIRKSNTNRPPYINDPEWRAFGPDFKKTLTAEW